MSCYHPLKAFRTATGVVFSERRRHGDILGDVSLPCGQCIGCRMQRCAEWELRCVHEAALHQQNCFVTLTYGRDRLPPGGSLCHEDYQRFVKRVAKRTGRPVRFYMCGEYGERTFRPHYHACLFGHDFRDRKPEGKSGSGEVFYSDALLTELWGHGFATVQDFKRECAGYTTRYLMQKVSGRDGAEYYGSRRPPYNRMSLRPGIGADWFRLYGRDVYPHDFVVEGGAKRRAPRYYDKMLKREEPLLHDELKEARVLRAREHWEDQTPERLHAREVVHRAQVSQLKRGFE